MKRIAIIGNIGAGKTTTLDVLCALLKKRYPELDPMICIEPVGQWEAYGPQKRNVLAEFYADPEKNKFAFQVIAFASRLVAFNKNLAKYEASHDGAFPDVVISERSIHTDRIFAETYIDPNSLEMLAYNTIHGVLHTMHEDFDDTIVIYVRAPPDTCYDRIHNKRRRDSELGKKEGGGVTIEQLKKLHAAHEDYFRTFTGDKYELSNGSRTAEHDIERLVAIVLQKIFEK
jgi:deoxycitidine kinase/deoxyguanosine kinase